LRQKNLEILSNSMEQPSPLKMGTNKKLPSFSNAVAKSCSPPAISSEKGNNGGRVTDALSQFANTPSALANGWEHSGKYIKIEKRMMKNNTGKEETDYASNHQSQAYNEKEKIPVASCPTATSTNSSFPPSTGPLLNNLLASSENSSETWRSTPCALHASNDINTKVHHPELYKKRHSKPKIDRSRLRKGKWTTEEEEFTTRIIHHFGTGLLFLPEGTTLRSYLAEKLNCDPMRITKKFAGASCLGKRVYHLCGRSQATVADIEMAKAELAHLEHRFRCRVEHGRGGMTPTPIVSDEGDNAALHWRAVLSSSPSLASNPWFPNFNTAPSATAPLPDHHISSVHSQLLSQQRNSPNLSHNNNPSWISNLVPPVQNNAHSSNKSLPSQPWGAQNATGLSFSQLPAASIQYNQHPSLYQQFFSPFQAPFEAAMAARFSQAMWQKQQQVLSNATPTAGVRQPAAGNSNSVPESPDCNLEVLQQALLKALSQAPSQPSLQPLQQPSQQPLQQPSQQPLQQPSQQPSQQLSQQASQQSSQQSSPRDDVGCVREEDSPKYCRIFVARATFCDPR